MIKFHKRLMMTSATYWMGLVPWMMAPLPKHILAAMDLGRS